MAMATPIPMVPDLQENFQELKSMELMPMILMPEEPDVKDEKIEEPEEEAEAEAQALVQPETKIEIQVSDKPLEVLDDLQGVDRLMVHRRLRVKGVLFLKGKRNRFFVRTPDQNLVYTIEEENRFWWVGYFCYGLRPLQLRVLNGEGCEVLRILRPYAFTTRVFPCQLQRLQVFSPPGKLIGTVAQQWRAVRPLYLVRDAVGRDIFEVNGPRITWACFSDVSFQITRPDGTLVASTTKRWEGIFHALFLAPVTDKFNLIYLDKTLTGEEKSLLLAVSLLFDYMYYDV